MIYEKIYLIDGNEDAYIEAYYSVATQYLHDAMLIIPGGGYHDISVREGEPIALAFLGKGINCFVLHYSIKEKAKFPEPLIEASFAMKYIKENAEKFGINAERVYVCGFSAGGHLAASLGSLWHTVNIEPYGINKPTGMVLGYPVITATENKCHEGSFKNILATENLTEENRKIYSLETKVDKNTCPAYIFHTAADTTVPVESALYFALALKENGIPFELHIFPKGGHGAALANGITGGAWDNTEVSTWVDEAYKWIKSN